MVESHPRPEEASHPFKEEVINAIPANPMELGDVHVDKISSPAHRTRVPNKRGRISVSPGSKKASGQDLQNPGVAGMTVSLPRIPDPAAEADVLWEGLEFLLTHKCCGFTCSECDRLNAVRSILLARWT
jgi:hypothetical protein